MDMKIKYARITDASLTTISEMYEFLFEVDMCDGTQHVGPVLHTYEELCTFFDVVGVQSGETVNNTLIRVLVDDDDKIILIGNREFNKWVDLKRFTLTYLTPAAFDILDTHKANHREREENTMKTNYNAEYIKGFLKGQEDRLRQRRLDPEYIATLVEQAEYLITRETDADCMKYITETFVEKISEHFYLGLNAKNYVNQVSEEFGIALDDDREIAINAIGIVVTAGCTGDYPAITNQ